MDRREVIAWSGVAAGAGLALITGAQAAVAPGTPEQETVEERDLKELETLAQESPEKLTDEELRRVLSAHEEHSVCPVCAGLPGQLDGAGPGGPPG